MRRVRLAALVLLSSLPAMTISAQSSWLDPIRGLDGQGRTREALERLEADPQRLAGDTEARLLRGVLLAKLGRTEEARQLYQQLIRERPGLPEAYNNLAVMHAAVGDYDTAIEILKQGLATHPSYRTTYDNLTKVYGKLAGEAYSKALGDERIDDEPLRLALINGLAEAGPAGGAGGAEPPVAPARQPPAEPMEPAVVAAPVQPSSSPSGAGTPPPGPMAEPAGETGDVEQEVWRAVQAWAGAWSTQQADLYLSFYDDSFDPPDGSSRAEWEQLRRRRLAAPEYIKVSLALLEVERPAADRAVAHFVQSYESDRFRDTVTKALELVRSGSGWRIAGERVEAEGP